MWECKFKLMSSCDVANQIRYELARSIGPIFLNLISPRFFLLISMIECSIIPFLIKQKSLFAPFDSKLFPWLSFRRLFFLGLESIDLQSSAPMKTEERRKSANRMNALLSTGIFPEIKFKNRAWEN